MHEIIHDVITGEITQRDLSDAEIAALENGKAEEDARLAAREAEEVAKEAARQAVFTKLGLSADEVAALLG